MNKLTFKLLSNNKEIINEQINYLKQENIIKFKINDDNYEYDEKNIILVKRDSEKELTINFKEKVIIINLLSNNIKIDYPMDKSDANINNNIVILNYTLESDKTVENTIIIEF
ncbi:MAG: hypothetical protein J1F35_02935 [Erysipelotrichales bacterium]|nr:hypothetical protein [Erysipelotrichales bacterium]